MKHKVEKVRIYRILKTLFVTLLVLVLFSQPMSGVSLNSHFTVNYDVTETFDTLNQTRWILDATDWSGGFPPVLINNTWSLEAGALVSAGQVNTQKLNAAAIQDNTSIGAWSIDVNIPSNAPVQDGFNRAWVILFSRQEMSPTNNYPFITVQFYTNSLTAEFEIWNQDDIKDYSSLFTTENLTFDVSHHYDFIRLENRFYTFLDYEMILNTSTTVLVPNPDIHYVTFASVQGSLVTFDNFTITSSGQQLLDELLTMDTNTTTDTSAPTSGIPAEITLAAFAIGVPVIIWRKKKK